MKSVLLCLVGLVALSQAQHQQNPLAQLIHSEVKEILKTDPTLSIDQCTDKCDALFDLVDGHDEASTDIGCIHFCECEIDKNCGHVAGGHPPPPNHHGP